MAPWNLGLELGRTSIAAAVARGPAAELVSATADTDHLTTPAVVYAAHGRFCTGSAAERRAIGSPDRLATNILDHIASGGPVLIGGTSYSAAVFLGAMVHSVLVHLTNNEGEPPRRVTLTHPTTWAADQVAALADAVRPATRGTGALELLPNLVAATIGHVATHPLGDGAALAIVDVGATGFETAVIGRRGHQLLLLSPQVEHGAVGGNDFDTAVVDHVDHVAGGAVRAIDTTSLQGKITLARLRRDCRRAKEALSAAHSVAITAYLPDGPVPVRLSRTAFEAAIRPQLDVVIEAVARTLRSVPDVHLQALVLTGDSTQIPLLQRLAAAITDAPEVAVDLRAAARGAAAPLLDERCTITAMPQLPGILSAADRADVTAQRSAQFPAQLEDIFTDARRSTLVDDPPPQTSGDTLPNPGSPGEPAPLETDRTRLAPPVNGAPGRPPALLDKDVDHTPTQLPASTPRPAPGRPGPPPDDARIFVPGAATSDGAASRLAMTASDVPDDGDATGTGWSVGWPPVAASGSADLGPAGPQTDHWPQPQNTSSRTPRSTSRTLLGSAAAAVILVAVLVLLLLVAVPGLRRAVAAPPAAPTAAPTQGGAGALVSPAPPTAPTRPNTASVDRPGIGALIPVGPTPGFAAASPSGRLVYVANRGGGQPTGGLLTVIDTSTDAVTAHIPIPDGPARYLAFSPDGTRLYVSVSTASGRGPDKVDVVDTSSNTVITAINVGLRPTALAVAPDGSEVWVPNHDSGTVSVIDAQTNTVAATIHVPPNPHWVAFSADGRRVYTADHESNLVAVLDARTRSVIDTIPVGSSPHSVAVHPTQPLVANVNYDGNSVSLIDTTDDSVLTAGPACRATCTTTKVGSHPQDLGWSPDGQHLYVTNVGDGTVSTISMATRAVTATIPVGASPTSITVLPSGEKAYVTNLDDGTVRVLELAR